MKKRLLCFLLLFCFLFHTATAAQMDFLTPEENVTFCWDPGTFNELHFHLYFSEGTEGAVTLTAEMLTPEGESVGSPLITAFGEDRITVRKRAASHTTAALPAETDLPLTVLWETPVEADSLSSIQLHLTLSDTNGVLLTSVVRYDRGTDLFDSTAAVSVRISVNTVMVLLLGLGALCWILAIVRNRRLHHHSSEA